jgi:hypothetical protein
MQYLELTDEQLSDVSGGLGDVELTMPININVAVAPQVNTILFSTLINSKVGGTGISQLNLAATKQGQQTQATSLL